jgi:hypothetical protein
MSRPLTLDDLMNAGPPTTEEGKRIEQEVEDEFAWKFGLLFGDCGIDPDRGADFYKLCLDESKTVVEHARDFFTPEEQAKLVLWS